MGADAYALRSLLDGEPTVALQIIQSPGANALDVSQAVRETMQRLGDLRADGSRLRRSRRRSELALREINHTQALTFQ